MASRYVVSAMPSSPPWHARVHARFSYPASISPLPCLPREAERRFQQTASSAIPASHSSAAASLLPWAVSSPPPPCGSPRSTLLVPPVPAEETASFRQIPRPPESHARCARRFPSLFSHPKAYFH